MAWFKKKPDPISDRARALNDEIAALESRIKTLDAQVQRRQAQPRLRSTALPQGATLSHAPPKTGPPVQEPIFEEVEQHRLHPQADTPSTPEHYNDLGMRKYDLPALLRRIRSQFRGPSTTNPKLVSYLAAGGIHGLRPLRHEKRVARRRFIVLAAFLFLALWGLIFTFFRHSR